MVFNILIDNTDDHEKNHALLRQADGTYALSPAFDVLPAAQGLGVQAMDVGERGTESSIDNAMSQAAAFGLRRDAAMKIVSAIAGVVDEWKRHFQAAGVRHVDIQMLEQYIDGANLGRQRADVLATERSAVPVNWSREKQSRARQSAKGEARRVQRVAACLSNQVLLLLTPAADGPICRPFREPVGSGASC